MGSPWILLLVLVIMIGQVKADVYRLILHHVDAGKSIPEKLALGAIRSTDRWKSLMARTKRPHDIYQSKVYSGPIDYRTVLQLGTPPINFTTVIDTGSDLVWVYCNNNHRHCNPCSSSMLNPSQSTSFSSISCHSHACQSFPSSSCPTHDNKYYNMSFNSCVYKYEYADTTYSVGEYAKDALTLSSSLGLTRTSKINIGCAHKLGGDFQNANGVIGLNLLPTSLISQLPFLDGKFSYCLTHYSQDAHSILFLGGNLPFSTSKSRSTPILEQSSFYSVHLQSITVGNTLISRCNASLDLNAGEIGTEGTIFDSGGAFTILSPLVFNAVVDAFIAALPDSVVSIVDDYYIDSARQYKACFDVSDTPNVKIPSMSFQFKGASFHPSPKNYARFEGSLLCLLILPGENGSGVIGNIMQQNHLMTFDGKGMKVSFMKADCTKL